MTGRQRRCTVVDVWSLSSAPNSASSTMHNREPSVQLRPPRLCIANRNASSHDAVHPNDSTAKTLGSQLLKWFYAPNKCFRQRTTSDCTKCSLGLD